MIGSVSGSSLCGCNIAFRQLAAYAVAEAAANQGYPLEAVSLVRTWAREIDTGQVRGSWPWAEQ